MAGRQWLLALAGLNGLMAVGFGAFAAHGLDDAQAQSWLATASQYQLAHAAAIPGLIAVAGADRARLPATALGLGALLFGSALDAVALGGPSIMGAVAPIGGTMMIAGWAAVVVQALRRRS